MKKILMNKDDKKLIELVSYIYDLLKLDNCSENVYTILSYMCRNNYFSNWEFVNDDIYIDGYQMTKNGNFYLELKD